MRVKKLASHLAKKESGKHQATIGDKRQDVSELSDLIFSEGILWRDSFGVPYALGGSSIINLYLNGERRAKANGAHAAKLLLNKYKKSKKVKK